MKKILAAMLALLLLCLCACGAAPEQTTAQPEDIDVQKPAEQTGEIPAQTETGEAEEEVQPDYGPLYFDYQNCRFGIFDEAAPILAALGEPMDTFVSESCAYQGNDYFYYYDGIELQVNEVNGVERITGITLADDTVTNPQGVRIGMSAEKALELMNMEYAQEGGVYTITSGSTLLMLQAGSDGTLTAVQYTSAGK